MNFGQASTALTMDDTQFQAALRNALGKAQAFGNAMSSIGGSMLMFSAPVVYGLEKAAEQLERFGMTALSVGGGFEMSMTKVAAISGATDDELAELTGRARELGATLPIMAKEAADAMGILASRGFDAEKMLSTVTDIVNLSIAQNYDLAATTDLVSAALTNFQLDASETARIADIFTTASNKSALSMEKLTNAFVYAAPSAAAMNMSIEELTAAMGALADSGMRGEMIGTSLRQILGKISSSTKIMGVATRDADGNFRNLNDIMSDIAKTGAGLTEFTEAFSVRAATAALTLSKSVAKTAELERQILEGTGSTLRQVERQLQTWENVVKSFESRIESLYITVFEQIKGSAKETTGSLTETLSSLERLVAKTEIAGKALDAFMEGLGVEDGIEGLRNFIENFDDADMQMITDAFRTTGETIRELIVSLTGLAQKVPWEFLLSNLDEIVYWGAAGFVGGKLLSGIAQATMAISGLVLTFNSMGLAAKAAGLAGAGAMTGTVTAAGSATGAVGGLTAAMIALKNIMLMPWNAGLKVIAAKTADLVIFFQNLGLKAGNALVSGISKAWALLISPVGMFATAALVAGGLVYKSIKDNADRAMKAAAESAKVSNDATNAAAQGNFTGFSAAEKSKLIIGKIVELQEAGVRLDTDKLKLMWEQVYALEAAQRARSDLNAKQRQDAITAQLDEEKRLEAYNKLQRAMLAYESDPGNSQKLFDLADARDAFRRIYDELEEKSKEAQLIDIKNLDRLKSEVELTSESVRKNAEKAAQAFKDNTRIAVSEAQREIDKLKSEKNNVVLQIQYTGMDTGEAAKIDKEIKALEEKKKKLEDEETAGADAAGEAVWKANEDLKKQYDDLKAKAEAHNNAKADGLKILEDTNKLIDENQKDQKKQEKLSNFDFTEEFERLDEKYRQIQEGLQRAVSAGLNPKEANEYLVESTKNAIDDIAKEMKKELGDDKAGVAELFVQRASKSKGVDALSQQFKTLSASIDDAKDKFAELNKFVKSSGGDSAYARAEIVKYGDSIGDMLRTQFEGLTPGQRAKFVKRLEDMVKNGGNKYAAKLLYVMKGGTLTALQGVNKVIAEFKINQPNIADSVASAVAKAKEEIKKLEEESAAANADPFASTWDDRRKLDKDAQDRLKKQRTTIAELAKDLTEIGKTGVAVPEHVAEGIQKGYQYAYKAYDKMVAQGEKWASQQKGAQGADDTAEAVKGMTALYEKLAPSAVEAGASVGANIKQAAEEYIGANPINAQINISPQYQIDIASVNAAIDAKAPEAQQKIRSVFSGMTIDITPPNMDNFFNGIISQVNMALGTSGSVYTALKSGFTNMDLAPAGFAIGTSISNGIMSGLDASGGLVSRITEHVMAALKKELKNAGA